MKKKPEKIMTSLTMLKVIKLSTNDKEACSSKLKAINDLLKEERECVYDEDKKILTYVLQKTKTEMQKFEKNKMSPIEHRGAEYGENNSVPTIATI